MMLEARRYAGDAAALLPPPGGEVHFCGLSPASSAFILAEMVRRRPETYLVVLPTPLEAQDFGQDLEFFWPEGAAAKAVLLCPGYEVRPFAGESPAGDLVFARLFALAALVSGRKPLVVATSAPAAMQLSLPKAVLSAATEYIEAGEETDREALLDFLARSGYYPTSAVQSQGDFSVRGGILDLYPPGVEKPVRAEFFGDFIESLRVFNVGDQRSVGDVREQVILPAGEVIYQAGRGRAAAERLRELARKKGWLDLLFAPLVEKISQEQFFPGLESFLPLFYDRLSSIFDYAGPGVIRVSFEPARLVEAGANHLERLETHMEVIRAEERPHLPLESLFLAPEELVSALGRGANILVHDLAFSGDLPPERTWRFSVETNEDLRALMDGSRGSDRLLAPLAARLKAWLKRDLSVVLACHTREQARRLSELLGDYGLYPVLEQDGRGPARDGGRFKIMAGFLSAGFALPQAGAAFVTEDELFGPKRRVLRRAAEEVKGLHLSSFQDLSVGDFLVHLDHGVGQYLGLVKLEAGGQSNDYLHLAYRGGDKLYVPVDRFSAVTKYVGADAKTPSLDKLGGTGWERLKARVKASIREMAEELLKLYAHRQIKEGFAFSEQDQYFREFEASFEYEETPDQLAAIDEVLKDMLSSQPMDRLVCGDVGYGKTEVALRAAFKAVGDGKQVAVLVPTTVLAEQHYQTFSSRLKDYPVTVEVLSRFKKPSEQKDLLSQLAAGRVDVVVGTHRLLQKDVAFKDLGLLVVDEEHRFGVAAKEKLKKLKTEVDVLTLSATPIPRTLHMSLSGIRDLSVIETPPQDRLAIKTFLLKYDEPTVCEAIARELERGGQVFFVHNRVKDIELLAGRLRRLMPLVRFGVAHGQQKERALEKVMLQFVRREIDVLVTTTIVESGLDFPTANTIIINNADHFGLAQMYQLRGRVGRSTRQAFAYLLVQSAESLTRDARKRLRALLDFSELGAGFRIALHDLQIRGAGNLLGAAQSGHIAAVGYEMYVRLMERTIKELKGETLIEEVEPEMVLGLPAYIPETYVPDTEQRLVLYRQLSEAAGPEDLREAGAMLLDRFGAPPLEVENLLLVMELRCLLKRARVRKLEMGRGGLTLTFLESGPADPEKVLALVHSHQDKAKLSPEGRLYLAFQGLDGAKGLLRIKNLLHGLVKGNNNK
ncbi:MAG: transcription-repair coupling factor [Thermodesulfobacteriota bacterium]